MRYRKKTGHNKGPIRVIRVITIVLLVFYSCLMLSAQINDAVFIQCKAGDYIMDMQCCLVLCCMLCSYNRKLDSKRVQTRQVFVI